MTNSTPSTTPEPPASDLVGVAAVTADVRAAAHGQVTPKQMRVAISGAGSVGRSIGRELLAHGHHVLIIDKQAADMDPATVEGAQWFTADACELTALEQVDLQTYDVVVAATSDDKANLVVSLLAKTELAVRRVIARVNDPRNEWLFTADWGVDVAVSTPRLIVAAVEEALSSGDVVELLSLRGGRASIISFTLPSDTTLAGRAVGRLRLPADCSLVALLRGARVIVPDEDDPFEPGDELLFVATAEAIADLEAVLYQTMPPSAPR